MPYWSAQKKPAHSGQVWSHQLGHFASTLADLSLQFSPDTLPKSLWKIPIFLKEIATAGKSTKMQLYINTVQKNWTMVCVFERNRNPSIYLPPINPLRKMCFLDIWKNMASFPNRCAKVGVDIKSVLKQHTLQEKNLHDRMLPGDTVLCVHVLHEQSRMWQFFGFILL